VRIANIVAIAIHAGPLNTDGLEWFTALRTVDDNCASAGSFTTSRRCRCGAHIPWHEVHWEKAARPDVAQDHFQREYRPLRACAKWSSALPCTKIKVTTRCASNECNEAV